jgi:hypothetical protein
VLLLSEDETSRSVDKARHDPGQPHEIDRRRQDKNIAFSDLFENRQGVIIDGAEFVGGLFCHAPITVDTVTDGKTSEADRFSYNAAFRNCRLKGVIKEM